MVFYLYIFDFYFAGSSARESREALNLREKLHFHVFKVVHTDYWMGKIQLYVFTGSFELGWDCGDSLQSSVPESTGFILRFIIL